MATVLRGDTAERDIGPDLIKSYAILGVVVIHVADFSTNPTVIAAADYFRTCVPLFIMLWSFYFERAMMRAETTNAVLSKRFRTLMIPYAFWTVVYFLLFNDVSSFDPADLLSGYWTGYGFAGQFFFLILFQWLLLQKFVPLWRSNFWTLAIAGVVFFGLLKWAMASHEILATLGHRPFWCWLPCIVLGRALARGKLALPNSRPWTFVAAGLFSGLIIVEFEWSRTIGIYFSPYVSPTVWIATLLVLTAVFSHSASGTFRSLLARTWGRCSLGIFVLNPLLLFLLSRTAPDILPQSPGAAILASVAIAVAICFGATLLVNVLRRARFGAVVG